VIGGLLLFSSLEFALSSRPHEYRDSDLFLVLLIAAIGVGLNPATFVAGVLLRLPSNKNGSIIWTCPRG
jgi:hypothetical protein